MTKLALYVRTARHLRLAQIATRLWRRLGGQTLLPGWPPSGLNASRNSMIDGPALPELDFDPSFLSRFDVDALCGGHVELLRVAAEADWYSPAFWRADGQAPLWAFNLHYHEYLLPLANAWMDTGEPRYLDTAADIVSGWVSSNPSTDGGPGWDPYTVAIRVANWLAFLAECRDAPNCNLFDLMETSLAEQGNWLACHLETDVLANHYLEELKALVLLAVHFGDVAALDAALPVFEAQVAEQVLSDGVHFELSPMYQKVVFEDLLRAASALGAAGKSSAVIEKRLSPMADFVLSMELGVGRTPLFNDCGDNVAKSAWSLLMCAEQRLGTTGDYRQSYPDAGYEIADTGKLKLIFDTGRPNPPNAMGHMHCDALSFELFADGSPVIVNCGTYQYQGELRNWFRSTAASNAPMVDGCEQHELWGQFRTARYGRGELVSREGNAVEARFTDYLRHACTRKVSVGDIAVTVATASEGHEALRCFYHLADGLTLSELGEGRYTVPEIGCSITVSGDGLSCYVEEMHRAPEFGLLGKGKTLVVDSSSGQSVTFTFENSQAAPSGEGGDDGR